MNFKEILKELTPKFISISLQLNKNSNGYDLNDLVQEMSMHLLEKWNKGEIEGYTKSYILQSCWFHIKNYLRKINKKIKTISLDDIVDGTDVCLCEMIEDGSESVYDIVNFKITVDNILSNGLTKREKEVFLLTLEGHTLREMGEILDISFVRVSKIENNIKKKVKDEVFV